MVFQSGGGFPLCSAQSRDQTSVTQLPRWHKRSLQDLHLVSPTGPSACLSALRRKGKVYLGRGLSTVLTLASRGIDLFLLDFSDPPLLSEIGTHPAGADCLYARGAAILSLQLKASQTKRSIFTALLDAQFIEMQKVIQEMTLVLQAKKTGPVSGVSLSVPMVCHFHTDSES